MDNREQLRRITDLTEQIAGLPKGYLSKKTIGGKVYYYHQWSENGVKQSRYLHDSEIAPLADKIEKRKELQAQLRMLKSQKSRRNEATGMKCTFMHKRTPCEKNIGDLSGGFKRQTHFFVRNQASGNQYFICQQVWFYDLCIDFQCTLLVFFR